MFVEVVVSGTWLLQSNHAVNNSRATSCLVVLDSDIFAFLTVFFCYCALLACVRVRVILPFCVPSSVSSCVICCVGLSVCTFNLCVCVRFFLACFLVGESCLHAEDGPLVERAKEEAKVRVVHQCYHDEAGPKTDCLAGPLRETAHDIVPDWCTPSCPRGLERQHEEPKYL